MRTKNLFVIAIAVAATLVSCGTKESKKAMLLDKAQWMIGEWSSTSPEGTVVEKWTKHNDSTYLGNASFVVEGDTVNSEIVTLEQKGADLFYVPTIEDQNDGKPVTFKLTESTDSKLVFENPNHDFPQKIAYTKVDADNLVAEISGIIDGEPQSHQFAMQRVKKDR
jgi:hypothetical protein